MMKLNRYDVTFEYVKGVNLIIADALSRAFIEQDETVETPHRPRIMELNNV